MGLLHTCPCTGKVVELPLPQAVYLSDNEIDRICLYEGGTFINNPWHDSHLEEGKIVPKSFKGTSLDDIEEYYDDDEEEDDDLLDTDMSLSGEWDD